MMAVATRERRDGRATTPWTPSPAAAVGILIAAQLVVWTLVPYLFATSLPLDVTADGVSWGHEWQLGYYKHPPLPSWLVETFFSALGNIGPFLLSQIAVGITYALVYRLGRELMSAREAAAGTLLLAGVYYFSISTPEWNHNVAQLPFWAAITLAYWQATTKATLRWWLLLGVCAALGMLAKYSTAMLLAALLLHLLLAPKLRVHLSARGFYAAFGAFALLVSPHVLWLVHHHFPSFTFYESRAGRAGSVVGWVLTPLRFLLAQCIDLLPAIGIATVAGFFGRDAPRGFLRSRSDVDRFLLFAWLGPPTITVVLSLCTGFGLRDMWGTSMWNLTGLVLVRLSTTRWEKVSLPRLHGGIALCFVILPACYLVSTVFGPDWLGTPSRTEWPQRAMAARLAAVWTEETHAPLRIVTGESWIAGLVAMSSPRPSVFIDADFAKAPWITPQRLRSEGTLIVWQIGPKRLTRTPPAVFALAARAPRHGILPFSWPFSPNVKPLSVGWAVVPPRRPGAS